MIGIPVSSSTSSASLHWVTNDTSKTWQQRELQEGGFAPHWNERAMTQWKKVELVDDATGCSNPTTDVTLMDEKEKKTQSK